MTIAASIAVGVFLGRYALETPPVQTASGWGWQSDDAMPVEATRDDYLVTLATGAEAWFKKRPDDAQGIATRIGQFRSGCSRLILSSHKPLPDVDGDWLREKCRLWAGKIDGHLADLEAGQDVLEVRAAMDETVRKLIDALTNRAAEGSA